MAGTKTVVKNRDPQIRCTDLRGEEIMSYPVVTVPMTATLREAAKVMVERNLSGLVVRDKAGKGIGVVTATDVVRHQIEHRCAVVSEEQKERMRSEASQRMESPAFQLENVDDLPVGDVMTPYILTLPATATIGTIARQMVERHIHRVLLERDKKIVGIVTALDIARAVGKHAQHKEGGPA
jgi:CBS domain-containing protein